MHQHFPFNGVVDIDFIQNIQNLFHLHYPNQFLPHDTQPFEITKNVTLRAIDLVSCNIRQFILLFDATNAPRISAFGKQILIVSPDQQQASESKQSSIEHNPLKQNKRM